MLTGAPGDGVAGTRVSEIWLPVTGTTTLAVWLPTVMTEVMLRSDRSFGLMVSLPVTTPWSSVTLASGV